MDPATEFLFQIPRGLEQSILLAVLVGFLVTFVLAESFGWVFVGVVVPGYLASVLVIQPAAGLAVMLDSVLTYATAKVLEQLLGRGGASSEFFGRERFFLLVIVSVFVRQHTQTWVWPLTIEAASPWLELPMSFQRGFSSIGIVLVPLMANLLWKLDLRRGTWQMLVTAGTTYALLAWWLLPDTTLSYSALELSYEDTAIDFVGNAKAYIIFLCTAYVAAQLNLYYGWDFNGILVPALLGLLWFHPAKLATTFGEAIVVFFLTQRLPKAPGLRRLTIEGPRKLALVFTSSVLLKWIIGWSMGDSLPTLKITDLYGFGYLLPSLLVVKMTQRKSMRAVLLPTVVASFSGFVLGSMVGFGLSFLDPPPTAQPRASASFGPGSSTRLLRSPEGVAALGHLRALERSDREPDHAHNVRYQEAWDGLARWIEAPDPLLRATLDRQLDELDLDLVPVGELEGRAAYALFERDGAIVHGWETALLVPGAPGPVLAVPRPVAEEPLAEAASALCRRMRCRALLVAGADVTRDPWLGLSTASYDIARHALREQPMLVLRRDPAVGDNPVLHVGAALPPSIDLRQEWTAEIGLEWSAPPVESAGPLPKFGGTLRLRPRDVETLMRMSSTAAVHDEPEPPPWIEQRERDPLVHTLASSPSPSAQEARYLELELVAPLIDVAAGRASESELERLAWRATQLRLELWRIDDCGDGLPCLALLDPLGREGLGWGALLVHRGSARAMAVEVPRPGRAIGTHQLGLELWHQLDARAIYIAPSTSDEHVDPLSVGNIHSPMLPFHQALDRTLGDGATRPLIMQVLGFGVERALDTDLVIGLGRPVLEKGRLPLKLQSVLRKDEGPLGWVRDPLTSDGSPLLHALSGLGSPAVEYSLELGSADVALLWFSPEVRGRFVRRGDGEEERRALALDIEYGEISEIHRLLPHTDTAPTAAPPDERTVELDELLHLASDYRKSGDIHALRRLLVRAEAGGAFEVSMGQGRLTKRPTLLLQAQGADWSLRGLALLDEATDRRDTLMTDDPNLRFHLGRALLQRSAAVVVRSTPSGGSSRAP
ncbi:poly-gamma-glutamate biosynthesis protein PgsC/CapC [Paraliomyxa miuraensis]|uniref:poly-gamma-glutamate biosynthesis protein PgsC/CapC n=1 Tax=Paraliomyxa miuraensis TaxID=376150 RepID=UPI00225B97C5|nr:poly-gamma-glutamate biosynthesis protein PgsC/CapC [Paraliomyxa miuraensis]MCX4245302.1 poly-gamma-glutamate biosynthesis protein PgsC/CapC [Paraliomyxa miuraensis]